MKKPKRHTVTITIKDVSSKRPGKDTINVKIEYKPTVMGNEPSSSLAVQTSIRFIEMIAKMAKGEVE